jgi:hypothetical protein
MRCGLFIHHLASRNTLYGVPYVGLYGFEEEREAYSGNIYIHDMNGKILQEFEGRIASGLSTHLGPYYRSSEELKHSITTPIIVSDSKTIHRVYVGPVDVISDGINIRPSYFNYYWTPAIGNNWFGALQARPVGIFIKKIKWYLYAFTTCDKMPEVKGEVFQTESRNNPFAFISNTYRE